MQVRAIIAEQEGDLVAAEAALVEQGRDVDYTEPMPPLLPRVHGKRVTALDDDTLSLQAIQQRVSESGAALAALKAASQQPVNSRTAFANYVRDSLLSMSDKNFKKARREINRVLSAIIVDEDDDDDTFEAPLPRPSSSNLYVPSRMSYPPYTSHETTPWQTPTSSRPTQQLYYPQPPHRHLPYQQAGAQPWSSVPSSAPVRGYLSDPLHTLTPLQPLSKQSAPLSAVLSQASQVLNGENDEETRHLGGLKNVLDCMDIDTNLKVD